MYISSFKLNYIVFLICLLMYSFVLLWIYNLVILLIKNRNFRSIWTNLTNMGTPNSNPKRKLKSGDLFKKLSKKLADFLIRIRRQAAFEIVFIFSFEFAFKHSLEELFFWTDNNIKRKVPSLLREEGKEVVLSMFL